MTMLPSGGLAVMQNRVEAPDSLDYFPTPPWATRALMHHVIGELHQRDTCWEPACGEGHMAEVLRERFGVVYASDVHDYGCGRVGSFVGSGADVITSPNPEWPAADWVITNPPFRLAIEFAERALDEARIGVALLVRSAWLEGSERYERLFRPRPPAIVAQFAERVPMVKGRWDPLASTATSYAWVVWHQGGPTSTSFIWIPPGCRKRLTRADDVARFCVGASDSPAGGRPQAPSDAPSGRLAERESEGATKEQIP
ncbi:MAG: methyltransferase [Hyphomicrobiaceae bacterium]